MKRSMILIGTVCLMLVCRITALPQQAQKPLTNDDVIKMVKSSLPESVVITSIRNNGSKLDTSPDALIALHNAGLTQAEMDAVMSAAGSAPQGAATPSATNSGTASAPIQDKQSFQPVVAYSDGKLWHSLVLEKTTLAQTKAKPTSLSSLSGDTVLAQSMQVGVYTAATGVAIHTGSYMGGAAVEGAGSVLGSMMAHRKAEVTYVWGVPQPTSTAVLPSTTSTFSVDYENVRRANPDDFEPVILKLTPAQNSCRIVGATRGKAESDGSPAGDWQIYSNFVEDRVPVKAQKLGTGKYQVTPEAELEPGEYAVALRPISKDKKFDGGDIARGQGEGLLFDAVWTFRVVEPK